jgi:hypothetical protein
MAAHLDTEVSALGASTGCRAVSLVWADALTIKVREDGRVVNVHALIVTGFNAGGHHEILGETPTRPKTALAGILVRPGRPAAYRPATGHRRCPSRAGRHISSAATTCPRC